MANSVTTPQDILDLLVKITIKLDELSFNSSISKTERKQAQVKADELRTVHLHLFAAEFNATTADFKGATDNLRKVMVQLQQSIADTAQIAATLQAVTKIIDLGTQLAVKAAKIALI